MFYSKLIRFPLKRRFCCKSYVYTLRVSNDVFFVYIIQQLTLALQVPRPVIRRLFLSILLLFLLDPSITIYLSFSYHFRLSPRRPQYNNSPLDTIKILVFSYLIPNFYLFFSLLLLLLLCLKQIVRVTFCLRTFAQN